MDDLITIAKIAKPRGLKGELVADLLTDFPERFGELVDVTAMMPDGERRELKIEKTWFQNGRVVLKFGGVDSIEEAELLRNAEICVGESEAVGLDSGEYFDWQLEGCDVETTDGTRLGQVRVVMRTGGTENLVVEGGEKGFLIPFAEAICTEVDIEKKLIVVDPPDGLLDF